MVDYKKIGLVNTREMFRKAVNGGYAIPAFNFNNMEQMQAIIMAAVETKSPVILQVSKGAREYANPTLLRYMAEGAVEYAKELGCPNPQIVLHLDHGDSFETCKSCIDMGFSSVMYTSPPAPAATPSPSPSAPPTAPTSSNPSSAPSTPRPAVSCLLRWLSTSSRPSRRNSPASPSCSMAPALCLRMRSTLSTPTVAP